MRQERSELRRLLRALEIEHRQAVEASNEWARKAQRLQSEIFKAKRELSREA